MNITIDDLSSHDIITLLEEHLSDMYATSPPESVHALDLNRLKAPDITFFSAKIDGSLAGCIAIKYLSADVAELKSMRTAHSYRKRGVCSKLLTHVIHYAQQQGFKRLSLETGTQDYFEPARTLYKRFNFEQCGPFNGYKLDSNSCFMTRSI